MAHSRTTAAALVAALSWACAHAAPVAPAAAAASTAAASASSTAAAAEPPRPAWPSQIRFLEDDWQRALQLARAQHKPIFVDSWATWCHTCLSMQRFVFPDAGLRPLKDAVIWLSIETEREGNWAFVDKFPAEGLPTLLVIDSDGDTVLGRWLGSGTVNEMRSFVQEALAAQQARAGGPALTEAAEQARLGDAAQLRNDQRGAAAAYRLAVEKSAPDDPARPERLVKLVNALRHLHDDAACASVAERELSGMPADAVGADFVSLVAGCAENLSAGSSRRAALLLAAESRLVAITGDAAAPLSVDDRSDALANLAELQESSGRRESARATMKQRARLLEEAAAAAPDAFTASTFDAHRTESYLYLGQPEKAEALLAGREKELPGDYNPPARLARVLLLEKRFAEAAQAVDRALGQMTKGQRRVGILGLKAQILEALHQPKAAVLREQLEVLRGLPVSQRRPEVEAKVEAELKASPN